MMAAAASRRRRLRCCWLCALSLQLEFLLRIALMAVVDPQSTTFQRSEASGALIEKHQRLGQDWVEDERIGAR